MKKSILLTAFCIAVTNLYAQRDTNSAADAVRYTTDNITGTARFRAMGGAFGALGGDPSAVMINPAGSAVFLYNTGTFTLSSINTNNDADYFGTRTEQTDNSFDINQLGAFFVFKNTDDEVFMNKFTVGFNYENINNFDNNIYTQGVNPTNSIDQYFLNYANGVTLNTLNNSNFENLNFAQQQAYLGYNAYIINPVSDNPGNTSYVSNYDVNANSFYQENIINTTGFNGKAALNFGAELKKRIYVGANLNVHVTDYIRSASFYENADTPSGLNSVRFNNERYTYGGGFSFNLGTIVKVTEKFRAGLAYESPTWLRLQDEITQSLASYCPECLDGSSNDNIVVSPFITFIMDDYTVKTPSKWTASMAYIFGKSGLVSVDYSLRDYSNTEFLSNGYDAINTELSNSLDTAGELRVGAEYRIKQFSFRGGYRYADSPYKNGSTMGDLTAYSGGLGLTFGNSRLDLAYTWQQQDMEVQFLNAGFTDAAQIENTQNNVTLSYTLDI